METYKINHELNQYDRVEGIEFNGLMPKLMETDGIDTTGTSNENVKFFGVNAKGSDSLEVVDINALNEDESGSTSGETSGSTSGGTIGN